MPTVVHIWTLPATVPGAGDGLGLGDGEGDGDGLGDGLGAATCWMMTKLTVAALPPATVTVCDWLDPLKVAVTVTDPAGMPDRV